MDGLGSTDTVQVVPLRYRKKFSASETVCELQFCVLPRKRVLLLYSLKSLAIFILKTSLTADELNCQIFKLVS